MPNLSFSYRLVRNSDRTMTTKFQPLQGKKPLSFRRLMALKQTGNDTFESLVAAWPPAHHTKAFGGHVFAQAMYAASKTVEQGLVAHVCIETPQQFCSGRFLTLLRAANDRLFHPPRRRGCAIYLSRAEGA